MTFEIALVLALVVATVVLFMGEWVAVDMVALGVVVILVASGVLTPADAFSGFASEVIVVLACLFVLAGALEETGVMAWVAVSLRHLAGRSEVASVASIMGLSAVLSAFLSNTGVTAVLMPGMLQLARQVRLAPSRLLMPLAFASILGGSCTLIGTSTNLAASGLMMRLGMEGLSLFELVPIGLVMTVVGIAYMVLVGRHLLPRREASGELSEAYELRPYLSELVVGEQGWLAGRRLRDSALGEEAVQVLAVTRQGQKLAARDSLRFEAADVLLLQGSRESLLRLAQRPGLSLEAAPDFEDKDLSVGDLKLAEAVVMPGSNLRGRTLRGTRFRQTYGASVLAMMRRGRTYPMALADLRLESGDVLLLLGSVPDLVGLGEKASIWVIGQIESLPVSRYKGLVALAALLVAIGLGASGLLPLSVSLLTAVLVVVVGRCVSTQDVYRLVAWRVLMVIGGMTALGAAMEETGAADLLAHQLTGLASTFGIPAVLAAFVVLTMLLTQPLSNAAAALVVLPVAVSTATEIGIDPRPLAILVTLSASLSFLTPLEPACLLVYGPGRYRFRDFVKVGLPLTVLAALVLLTLVPTFWPLR